MKCPLCGFHDQKVLDSRVAKEGDAIRRRRECLSCGRRFTTYEAPERPRLYVIKRGGERDEFDREKILNSMMVACGKRPVPIQTIRDAAAAIERDCFQEFEDEVSSKEIGERVMQHLMGIDTVAYIRFASVYKEFATISDFREIVESVNRGSSVSVN